MFYSRFGVILHLGNATKTHIRPIIIILLIIYKISINTTSLALST